MTGRVASLVCCTEPEKQTKRVIKKMKNNAQNRRNGPVIKSVESVLRPEESIWWEIFVEEVGFEQGVIE